ncbi:hypothetical protein E2P81_ATG05640 [Venturia nashicola]|uniref:Uncharacterized protein n=1 Tax=Venturia nashicola TaxID=86259 RepID=A0A4Z1NY38_9PEZI|nr:hypothetical protein E6O75_ATG05778 [Venturia nashicola]TLD32664.1 hypothetical protein E2P81_ATG05640 [Venturia nashicola]
MSYLRLRAIHMNLTVFGTVCSFVPCGNAFKMARTSAWYLSGWTTRSGILRTRVCKPKPEFSRPSRGCVSMGSEHSVTWMDKVPAFTQPDTCCKGGRSGVVIVYDPPGPQLKLRPQGDAIRVLEIWKGKGLSPAADIWSLGVSTNLSQEVNEAGWCIAKLHRLRDSPLRGPM